ncbi:hypothetical protein [Streptomyces sp. NPDC004135]
MRDGRIHGFADHATYDFDSLDLRRQRIGPDTLTMVSGAAVEGRTGVTRPRRASTD